MCDKYQPTTWKCLFCDKSSCRSCTNIRYHCDYDHKGHTIILNLNNGVYELWADNSMTEKESLYQNQYEEGWKRNLKPEGWKANFGQIDAFFNKIIHSESTKQKRQDYDSDNEEDNNNEDEENEEEDDYGNEEEDEDDY